jgi:hypothetical protein
MKKKTTWVKNYTDLGKQLKPVRSRVFLQRYAKKTGAPEPRQNGEHNVEAWQVFVDANCGNIGKEGDFKESDAPGSVAAARKSKLDLENERLEIINAQYRGDLVEVELVKQFLAEQFAKFSKKLRETGNFLSTKLTGVNEPGRVKKILDEAHRGALLAVCQVEPGNIVEEAGAESLKKKAGCKRLLQVFCDLRKNFDLGLGLNIT